MVKVKEFFNEEYITFAAYDNSRKINSICDGLKTSQRKVLYTIIKNNIDSEPKEIKVEQLAAKASEQTQYLHGATSLSGVTVGLASKYVGSNNINILEPDGNFGTRFIKDASAPRYIYTYLSDIAKYIFKKEDEPILEIQSFEGELIEPKNYLPIIPMILVNGADGLSVGFSSNIAPRDPKQLISWLESKLNNKKYNKDFIPYFKGYEGSISKIEDNKYLSKGVFIKDNSTQLTIIEIPTKYSLKSYLKVLDTLCDKDIIKSYQDLSDNDKFMFIVKVKREFFENKSDDDILTTLKLTETISDNLVLLDSNNMIKEYASIKDILDEYFNIRLQAYKDRKAYQLNKLNFELLFNKEKAKFIKYVISKKIKIDESVKNIISKLEEFKFNQINNSFDYLLDMKVSSFSLERVEELNKKISNIEDSIKKLTETTEEAIWLEELKVLKSKL